MLKTKCKITFPAILGGTINVDSYTNETLTDVVKHQLQGQAKFLISENGQVLAHVRCFLNGAPINDLNQSFPNENNELLFLTAMSGG